MAWGQNYRSDKSYMPLGVSAGGMALNDGFQTSGG